jgi:hypothetical protein
MLLEPSHHVMTAAEAYMDGYGPAVTQQVYESKNAFSQLMDLSN